MKSENKKKKYKVDLPERRAILDHLSVSRRPQTLDRIATALDVADGKARNALLKRIKAMQRDRQLISSGDGYRLAAEMELYQGIVIGHADGYGFLNVVDEEEDIYLSAEQMRALLHGDQIVVHCVGIDKRGRKDVIVLDILERANHRVVGHYLVSAGTALVIPCNRRIHQNILIPEQMVGGATNGEYVVAEITKQPDKHTPPIGRIVEVLGKETEIGLETEIAIRTHGISDQWPDEVLTEIEDINPTVVADDIKDRTDIRDLPLITIDGDSAKDFDDAVYCQRRGSGWRLLVAIADVSHYVSQGTALDEAALDRGNSVYFPRHVVPMLPEILSNELCSLKPKVDRLCIVCDLQINNAGAVISHRFFEGSMNSAARITYTEFSAIVIDGDKQQARQYGDLVAQFKDLYSLFLLMNKHRQKNGVLDFRSVEPYFKFDQQSHVSEVHILERNDAHRLIEEFMLAANVAAAEFLLGHEIPALYRIHAKPKRTKLEALHSFLVEMGLKLGGGDTPVVSDYADLMAEIKGYEDATVIETLLLRSMQLAAYSEKNSGHFGLSFPAYTHFTSPIRRYPDLLVHRAIRHLLQQKKPADFSYSVKQLHTIAEHCSASDRRAEEASRDVIQHYKCDFMQNRLGECYRGIVVGVASFGVFIELDINVTGLLHVSALPKDRYQFDPLRHRLSGANTNREIALGNSLRVRIAQVDMETKKIDFSLAE